MSQTLIARDHVIMARNVSSGTIAGAAIGAAAAVILILVCSLPFLLKCRRKRRMRKRQQQHGLQPEMGMRSSRPVSEAFGPYPNSRLSQARLASTAATSSDRDSQPGKDYAADGITFHQAAAPSPAAFAQTLRTCSPAPSAGVTRSSLSVADAVAIANASRNASPAIGQERFTPPPEGQADRDVAHRTSTIEPESLTRSGTGSLRGVHPPSLGGTFKKIHAVFHRGSTRSSGSDSAGTDARSMDVDLDQLDQAQTAHAVPYLRDDRPPSGGAAAEYYSGAPLSPPAEPYMPFPGPGSEFINFIGLHGAALAGTAIPHAQPRTSQYLGNPPKTAGAPPSPVSPFVRDQELSSDDGEAEKSLGAKSDDPTTPPRGLPFEPSPKKFEPPPGPSQPAPGTLNPMDVMKPSTDAEQAAWVDTEIWKMENTPPPPIGMSPPQSESSPPPNFEPYQPYQPDQFQSNQPDQYLSYQSDQYQSIQQEEYLPSQLDHSQAPGVPRFQAVVRHPTDMDVTGHGQVVPQTEEQAFTDISDTSSPGYDQYAYGPSPSNHTSPETRLTASPSPRSSISNRPSSSWEPATGEKP